MGFGSDGACVTTGIRNGVAGHLKDKVSPFILNIHCVAYSTNFASLDASSTTTRNNLSTLFDNLINDTTFHFKGSSKINLVLMNYKKNYMIHKNS